MRLPKTIINNGAYMQYLTKPHKAPGKAHRKGISLAELFRKFPTDLAAERWFERSRWDRAKQNLCCPRQGH